MVSLGPSPRFTIDLHFSAPQIPLNSTKMSFMLSIETMPIEPVSTVTMETTVTMRQFDCDPAHIFHLTIKIAHMIVVRVTF